MVITLGQQYNVGEKPTVLLYTCINRDAGTPKKKAKTETMWYTIKHGSNNILYMSCKYKATTWYLTGFPDGSNLGSTA